MHWPELLKKIIDAECRGIDAEFLRKTGLSTAHLANWRKSPSMNPHLFTIEKIERGLGIKIRMQHGRPTGYEAVPAEPPPPQLPLQIPSGMRIVNHDTIHPPRTPSVPRSARDVYDNFEFFGGKTDWLDLTDTERGYFEALYARMEAEIDEANAERERRVEKAVSELHRLVRDKLLGITN